jgi:outer membrane protein OmpA-like peptidoglycan-associated protein
VAFAGVGAGLAPGYQTPAWRWFVGVGVRHSPDPDRDRDGIPNVTDRCPDRAEDPDGFQDDDGCPEDDNDRDGILDPDDACPNDAEDKDYFEDEDGCPDPDNDGDGVPDTDDQCPKKAEDIDGFEDADGCPDPDNDGDGILDPDDQCPLEKETINDFEDEDGCPDKKLAEYKEESKEIKILEKVHFRFMSSEILAESHPLLDQVYTLLVSHPEIVKIQIEGHTDKSGPRDLNMELSQTRANAVQDYLVEKGIAPSRLVAKGYGWTRLIDYRSGPEANQINRRVEFKVLEYAPPANP